MSKIANIASIDIQIDGIAVELVRHQGNNVNARDSDKVYGDPSKAETWVKVAGLLCT